MIHRLSLVLSAENKRLASNVEESDYTVFTWQDPEFELELATEHSQEDIFHRQTGPFISHTR